MSLVALLFFACNKTSGSSAAEQKKATDVRGTPVISAAEPEFDFGKVKQGTDVEHIYRIENTGTANLVIERTTGS